MENEFNLLCRATNVIPRDATCRTCAHRLRFELNPYSPKIIQCCGAQPSKRSNSGFKTIKVTNPACWRYVKVENYGKDKDIC